MVPSAGPARFSDVGDSNLAALSVLPPSVTPVSDGTGVMMPLAERDVAVLVAVNADSQANSSNDDRTV